MYNFKILTFNFCIHNPYKEYQVFITTFVISINADMEKKRGHIHFIIK